MVSLFTQEQMVPEHASYWRSDRGRRALRTFSEAQGPIPELRSQQIYHFHRFMLGASDDAAILGWRHVMNARRDAEQPPKIKRTA